MADELVLGELVLGEELVEPLVEPLAAPLLGVDGAVLGAVLELELDEPPEAESFFDMSTDAEPEVELDGALDGELGVVVEPADEDDEPGVVRVTVRSPSRSQPASIPAPSAREIATARGVSLMGGWPPWLGYRNRQQGSRLTA